MPSSTTSRAAQFGRPLDRCAWRADPIARRTPPCDWNAGAFAHGAPPKTADARSTVGDTPSFAADSPLKLGAAWLPASGARPVVACAQAPVALHPQAECGGRGNGGGAQGFLLGTPGELAGARAPVRDLEVSTVLVIVRTIQIQTLGGGAWERVLGCWGGPGGCRGGMPRQPRAARRRWALTLGMRLVSGRDKTAAA